MRDKDELVWYLSDGITYFERSQTGYVLERLEMESCVSEPCPICDNGIVLEKRKVPDKASPTGFTEMRFGEWCWKCKGTGVMPVRLTLDERRMVESSEFMSPQDREGTRSQVADSILVKFAHVSRILLAMPSDERADIIDAYGDEGEELSHGVKGREWALMPRTEAGQELLRQERERKSDDGVTEPEKPIWCIVSLADLPKNKKRPERTTLLEAAAKQAAQRLKRAELAWDEAVCRIEEGRQ